MCIMEFNRPMMVIEKNNLSYDEMIEEIKKGNHVLASFPNSVQYLYYDEGRMKGRDFTTGLSSEPWLGKLKDGTEVKDSKRWFIFKYER